MHIDNYKPIENKKAEKRYWSWGIVRGAVTISIFAYIGFKINWAVLSRQFMQSNLFWLFIACFLLGISFLVASVRWRVLLRVQDIFLPLKVVVALTLIGQFFNSFLLGSTGGDVVKGLYISRYSPSRKAHGAMTIIMDRAIGLFVLVCIALCATSWKLSSLIQQQDTRNIAFALLIIFGIMLGGAVSLTFVPFKQLPFFPHKLWNKIPKRDIIETLVAAFRQHKSSVRQTLKAVVCSVAIWFVVFSAGYCIALAIHLKVAYIQMLVTLSIVSFIISLPISIGGHGIREGAFVAMFTILGIITIDKQTGMGREPAVLFSLLYYALLLIWSLVGGLVYLTFQSKAGLKKPDNDICD
ncbi:MAG: lysylphosphatidylglycerol synthase transmembrane domain-containing protein [Proteobacteria bacterium]|nr:lysylphosphatidylglycerol synthase transmembrane domain-containing protein [Pseudomonadota bacterium]